MPRKITKKDLMELVASERQKYAALLERSGSGKPPKPVEFPHRKIVIEGNGLAYEEQTARAELDRVQRGSKADT